MTTCDGCVETARKRTIEIIDRAVAMRDTGNATERDLLLAETTRLRVMYHEPQCHVPGCPCADAVGVSHG